MRTNRSALTKRSLGVLLALALSLVATTAALAAPSIARFDAEGVVLGVGPGPEYGVDAKFIRTGRNNDLRMVLIRTSDEQVGGALVPGVTACTDRDGGASCAATSALLTGSGLLSLHDSVAQLRNITVIPDMLGPGNDGVIGSLSGVLNGDFTIANPAAGTASGKAILRISGTGTYGCFGAGFAPVPLAACEAGLGLFVPVHLDIVDNGKFVMNNFTGAFEGLATLGGKLQVTVSGATGVPGVPVGTISVTDGRAVFR